jgi:hypothetical protein
MLAELEVQRKAELHTRTTRQLRAAISRESAAAKAAEEAAAGKPPSVPVPGVKLMPEWVVQLMRTEHGQRVVFGLLSRGRKHTAAPRRGKRGRANHGPVQGTASSHSHLPSPLASISETDPLGEEHMALLQHELAQISGVSVASSNLSSETSEQDDEYIMPDASKFTVDADGFIVPVEQPAA